MFKRAQLVGLALLLALSAPVVADPQHVSFPTPQGFRIAGDFYPAPSSETPAPMVILLHMYKSDRKAWRPLAEPLQKAGFAVLAIDLRGHGESATSETQKRVEERDTTLFQEMQDDVRGAYDWLAQQPNVDRARFALVGASVGCSIALQYAVKDRSVDAIVCLTPGTDYLGLDSVGDIRQIRGRSVLMLATKDEKQAAETLAKAGNGVETRFYDGSAHGTKMMGKQVTLEFDVMTFLQEHLGSYRQPGAFGTINSNIYHLPGSEFLKEIAPTNLRYYSSPTEAESRGLRKAKVNAPRGRKSP